MNKVEGEKFRIVLAGCGKMGRALVSAWMKFDLIESLTIVDPHNPEITDPCVSYYSSFDESIFRKDFDVLVVAVKPQILKETFEPIAVHIPKNSAVLSIAAGQSLKNLENIFGDDMGIIRCMPNTPASVGQGMSVAVANAHVTDKQRYTAHNLLSAAGKSEWIEDEVLMDAVTALSGSGPAYVFYFIECLANAGEKLGLSRETSMLLARQTVIGSAALADFEGQTSAKTLRENVTSPNGTTFAALNVLMNGEFEDIISRALLEAKNRSVELNQ